MTILAGVDVHAAVSGAVRGVLPLMTLKQNGVDVSGEGLIDGDIATFISRTIVAPRVGDVIEFNGTLRTIAEIGGSEDAWELTLNTDEVPALDDTEIFNFNVESIGAGRILLTRLDAGRAVVRGQWRQGNNAWFGFSMEGRSLVIETGAGEVEIAAYRVNSDGTSTEPVNRSVVVT